MHAARRDVQPDYKVWEPTKEGTPRGWGKLWVRKVKHKRTTKTEQDRIKQEEKGEEEGTHFENGHFFRKPSRICTKCSPCSRGD